MNFPALVSPAYHIHFYCTDEQIPLAQKVREALVNSDCGIEGAGPVRNRPIGPHPLPMFEAWFPNSALDKVLRWAMQNRRGLSVMLHPLSGSDLADHRDHAMWLGSPLPLRLDIFENSR